MAQLETSPLSARRRAPPSLSADVRPPAMKMAGEYDVTTVGELSAMFSSAIAADDADLVVDLSEVSFMDAATISVIIRAQAFLGAHGRGLRLRDPSKCARRLLVMCDLDPLIQADVSDRDETISGSALASWVAVPPTGPALDASRMPAVVVDEDATAFAADPRPNLSLVGAMPVALRSHIPAPMHVGR